MTEFSTMLVVRCNKCGKSLSASAGISHNGRVSVDVDPCEHCVDEAHADGNTEGYAERDGEVAELEKQIADLLDQLPPPPLPDCAAERPQRLIQH